MAFAIDKKKTALLVMGYQAAIVDRVPQSAEALLAKVALAAARAAGMKVIFAVLMDKIYPRQAEVLGVDAFVAALKA
jgi:hypothetical protein